MVMESCKVRIVTVLLNLTFSKTITPFTSTLSKSTPLNLTFSRTVPFTLNIQSPYSVISKVVSVNTKAAFATNFSFDSCFV